LAAVAPESSSSPRLVRALRTGPVWLVGIVAAVAAAAVTEAFTLAARAAGVPMDAAGVWEEQAQHLPVGYIARSVVLWSIGGILLAVALDRWAARPVRPFVVATVAFTVLSLAAPAFARDTAVSTQLVLAASHVLAGTVVIVILASRLGGGR
jgi:hypothetical protein